jgi:FdhD protein
MLHPPQRATTTEVVEWDGGVSRRFMDDLAGEEPVEIRVGSDVLTVTMRTPGDEFELAAGLLYSEGLVSGRDDITRIAYGEAPNGRRSGNVVQVTLRGGTPLDLDGLERRFVAPSSCGVCGRASLDALRTRALAPPNREFDVDPAVLTSLPSTLRQAQRVFGRTGGLHAAGLFDAAGRLLVVREDIGRHNAVDKVIGVAVLRGEVPLSERVVLVSGRGGFEIVQKALVAGLPILASVSAPSNLAVRLARQGGLTLIGFLRDRRFVTYSHADRLSPSRGHEAAAGQHQQCASEHNVVQPDAEPRTSMAGAAGIGEHASCELPSRPSERCQGVLSGAGQ